MIDRKKLVKVYNHKGGFTEIEVSLLEEILYKLRPRKPDETPRQRVEAVQETLEAIQSLHKEAVLKLIGEDEHSEYGIDDDTDYCYYRNELRAELRATLKGKL